MPAPRPAPTGAAAAASRASTPSDHREDEDRQLAHQVGPAEARSPASRGTTRHGAVPRPAVTVAAARAHRSPAAPGPRVKNAVDGMSGSSCHAGHPLAADRDDRVDQDRVEDQQHGRGRAGPAAEQHGARAQNTATTSRIAGEERPGVVGDTGRSRTARGRRGPGSRLPIRSAWWSSWRGTSGKSPRRRRARRCRRSTAGAAAPWKVTTRCSSHQARARAPRSVRRGGSPCGERLRLVRRALDGGAAHGSTTVGSAGTSQRGARSRRGPRRR